MSKTVTNSTFPSAILFKYYVVIYVLNRHSMRRIFGQDKVKRLKQRMGSLPKICNAISVP